MLLPSVVVTPHFGPGEMNLRFPPLLFSLSAIFLPQAERTNSPPSVMSYLLSRISGCISRANDPNLRCLLAV